MSVLRYTLPWPPSVNTYWRTYRGRMLISRAGRAYRDEVAFIVADARRVDGDAGWYPTPGARLRVRLDAHPPDLRRRDLDNLPKAVLDALAHADVYEDDHLIDLLVIKRHAVDRNRPRLVVTVEEIDHALP